MSRLWFVGFVSNPRGRTDRYGSSKFRQMIGKLLNIRPLRKVIEPMLFEQTLRAAERFEEGSPCDPRHYMMMIRRFCSTNGVSQDQLHEVIRQKRPKPEVSSWPLRGVAGDFDRQQIGEAVAALNKDGFYRFPNLLPEDLVDELRELALTVECGRNRPAANLENRKPWSWIWRTRLPTPTMSPSLLF